MNELKKKLSSASGFTLIELLLVIVIIGILSGVLIAVINPAQARQRAQESVMRGNVDKICLAMQACAAARTTPYTDCDEFGEIGVNDPSGTPAGVNYLLGPDGGTTLEVTATGVSGSACEYICTYNTADGTSAATAPVVAADCLAE